MRQVMVRKAILRTLKENPDGLSAVEILDNIDKKHRRRVTNALHISNLVKGMKHIRKIKKQVEGFSERNSYMVNLYLYDDEGAET